MSASPDPTPFDPDDPGNPHIEDILGMDWVRIADLRIPRYQRPERQNIDRMVLNWNPRKAGAIVVSERDGSYWTVDGQTRAKAARRLGIEYLLGVVHYGLDEPGEAELFLALNRDRLAVSAVARHIAESYALDKRALAIDEVLARNDLVASQSGGKVDGRNPFPAIVSAERVYDEGGPELLDVVLQILAKAFARDSARFRGALVQGLGYFLARDPWSATPETVQKTLARVSSSRLDEIATHWQAVSGGGKGHGGGSPVHMARAIASLVYRDRGTEWKPIRPK